MRYSMRVALFAVLPSALAFCSFGAAKAQTALPEVQIKPPDATTTQQKPKPKRRSKTTAASGQPTPAATGASPTAASGPLSADAVAAGVTVPKYQSFDAIRNDILPITGTNAYSLNQAAIQAQPLGDDTPIEKTLLQTPGFSKDSAASGALHLRNDHANVQYRIDGVWIPDGVSGFTQLLDSAFIGELTVIDGALPAEYGLHNTGIVDITPRSNAFEGGGSVGILAGSQGTVTPSFQYGGTYGRTEYYVIGRGFQTNEGIENPIPNYNPIHDLSDQAKFFGYAKTYLGDGSTVVLMSGVSDGAYQIPNNPGQPIVYPVPGAAPVPSSQVNENQFEQNYYNVLAWQKSLPTVDFQVSAFSRYSSLNFIPDQVGDLEFNGVASNVFRSSFLNGVEGDASWRVNSTNTVRFGLVGSGELANANNTSTVFPVDGTATSTVRLS